MLVILRKPRRRKLARRSIKNMDPGGNLPKPPVEKMHVAYVTSPPPPATAAGWDFDRPINDPTGSVAELRVNGQPGLSWSRSGDRMIIVQYGFSTRGKTWSCADGAAGIVSTEGNPLAAGSGMVG